MRDTDSGRLDTQLGYNQRFEEKKHCWSFGENGMNVQLPVSICIYYIYYIIYILLYV